MARLPIGRRIRDARKEHGMNQSVLAKSAGISPSYLNLIEHDKRMIGGALLGRIAKVLDIPADRLNGSDDSSLFQQTLELVRKRILPGVDEDDAPRLVADNPKWARVLIDLHRKYQAATETSLALSDRLNQDPALMELSHAVLNQITAIRSFAEILESSPNLEPSEQLRFSGIIAGQSDSLGASAREMINLLTSPADTTHAASPEKEVDDFIILNGNYFADLEDAARRLHTTLSRKRNTLEGAIDDVLTRTHKVNVVHANTTTATDEPRPPRTLVLDETALDTTNRFRKARALMEIECADIIEDLAGAESLSSPESRTRARLALSNYAASALLFPYDQFLESAEAYRYDIERLGLKYHGSFEQIAHRLITLRRPGSEGVPFAFLRADPAGNLSKPFSTQGLPMPRFGSACPLWAIYAAFSSRDRTVAQLASMPQGERYILVARRLSKRAVGFGAPRTTYSVMIGCEAAYSDRIVYADAFAPGKTSLETPVGFTCRSCPRPHCQQRAQPTVR